MEENNSLSNKYDAALAKYNTHLSDADIQARVADLIEKKVPENNTEEVKKFLFTCIDLTTLNSTDSDESVMRFTEKVNQFDDEFPDLKNVAAICVYPNFAAIVKNTLEVDGVNIACVSGGFPSSQTFTEVKVAETALAIADGADEIAVDRVPGVRLKLVVLALVGNVVGIGGQQDEVVGLTHVQRVDQAAAEGLAGAGVFQLRLPHGL